MGQQKTISVGLTDVGRKRAINEDAYLADDDMGFYVVADGVGGHSKGEVASRETIEQLQMWVYGARGRLDELVADIEAGNTEAVWEIRRLLESGVQSACYMVYGMAELDPDKRGMSTTCSALLIRAGYAFAAHVGDSRVYRLRDGVLAQLTVDHSLVAQLMAAGTPVDEHTFQWRHVVTRALGTTTGEPEVQIDRARSGDVYLVCSDGLSEVLAADDIAALLEARAEQACRALVDAAYAAGSRDNISAIVVRVL